jgi:dTDP-glucose 4,6-dehydratase
LIKKILITGGCGFIGSALIKHILTKTYHKVINIDKLTYAGNLNSLLTVKNSNRYLFKKIDICDSKKVRNIFSNYKPDIVIHLAGETHVDRSIDNSEEFIKTNILGTYFLLEEARKY